MCLQVKTVLNFAIMRRLGVDSAFAILLLISAAMFVNAQTIERTQSSDSEGRPSVKDADVTPPRVTYGPNPKYPKDARLAAHQGDSILSLVVGTDGRPYDIEVVRPLDAQLDESAIEKVRTWRYEPALKGDTPVEVQIKTRIRFRLYDKGNRKIAQLWDLSDENDPKADLQLSKCYFEGDGVSRDEELGFQFLKMAADWDMPEAQFLMGDYYYKGQSGQPDWVAAYMWYALSKRSGGRDGETMLKVLAAQMSPEDLGEADTRVAYWPEEPPNDPPR